MAGLAEAEKFVEWKTGTPMVLADTTKSDFQGAGASSAKGLVPDPGNSGTTNRYLNETGAFLQISASQVADLVSLYSGNLPSYNAKLAVTVSASAALINIYNINGSVPTTAAPAYLVFRTTTEADGGFGVVSVNTSLSLTIPAGATMGATNGNAFRLWVVGQLNAGVPQLGVINTVTDKAISPLRPFLNLAVASLAMTTASDTAAIIYAPAAASGPINILGNFTYESGLAAAGEYTASPSSVVLVKVGTPLPGDLVNQFGTQSGVAAGGNVRIPMDNTVPQITEGVQFLSAAGSFTSRANLVEVQCQGFFAIPSSVSASPIMALFQDSVASAFATGMGPSAGFLASFTSMIFPQLISLQIWINPGVARYVATTFTMRAGPSVSVTVSNTGIFFNSFASATASAAANALFNGNFNSYLSVREYQT